MSDDLAKYHRKDWMTDDQWYCTVMLADLFCGFHHMYGTVKPFGLGIELNSRHGHWATFDFDGLTRAVIMAHDRMVRFEIRPSGPGLLKLVLWRRHTREGPMNRRHPTMEQALATYRGKVAA